ncbi:UNVERIFIED_CONTAM: hypothetical protein HDU68_011000, partial [Siphonaria sp. JEL0065]
INMASPQLNVTHPPSASMNYQQNSNLPGHTSLPPLSQILASIANGGTKGQESSSFMLVPRCVTQVPSITTQSVVVRIVPLCPQAAAQQQPTRFQVEVPGGIHATSSRESSGAGAFKLTILQLNMLKLEFAKDDTPSAAGYDRISIALDIPRKFLLTWYRHRRAKDRKAPRK